MKRSKTHKSFILFIIGLLLLVIALVIFMTLKNTADLGKILNESVKSQLISISIAARELIDVENFDSYNTQEDIDKDSEAYAKTLQDLRTLQKDVGAEYIYALKQINGKYYFIFDTDPEDSTSFVEYELSPVHEQAFLGKDAADVMNVVDEWGSFNTGAVPIWKNGKIIGIISTDIEDAYIQKSNNAARGNAIYLIVALSIAMCFTVAVILLLLRRVQKIQDKLFRMANYDSITGLPNRQYLMNYLTEITEPNKTTDKANTPFALFFIDLDNFKRVNDNAGHDTGDELLRSIAEYLSGIDENSKSFRPTAGILNVSARIGGDEFVKIVPGVGTELEAEMTAGKLLDQFNSNAFNRYIEKYQVGLSIGIALYPYHSDNFNVLIKFADIAMYHAKNSGKNTFRVYNDEMAPKNEK